jgi:ribosomal protein L11 methyltransferase
MAPGTGAHPCTQLCLAAMERWVKPGDRVLDLGAGSGLLVAAANLLGGWAAGCDIDHAAAAEGRRNLLEDAVPARLFCGSTRALRDGCVDWIVANINAAVHRQLAPEYARVARRGLILSGFPPSDAEATRAAQSLPPVDTLDDGDWRCLVLCKDEHS